MKSSIDQYITPAIRAEAAAWVARLHGPDRDARTEAGFKSWLSASAVHARAFEQTTDAWDAIGSVPAESLSSMVRWDRIGTHELKVQASQASSFSRGRYYAFAATLILSIVLGALSYDRLFSGWYVTQTGEQRTVVLRDGSRIHLNTDSRLRVKYSEAQRRIELEAGEALFEVAKRADWPFVVTAATRKITALGTSFLVRKESTHTSITLIEGRITVSNEMKRDGASLARDATLPLVHERDSAGALVLAAGERLTFAKLSAPIVDRPLLERVTAWQRGLVLLDNTPLADAVAEMNRYNSTPIVLSIEHGGPAVGSGSSSASPLKVSGAFRAGDSLSFAQAVARTYRLDVANEEHRIVLMGSPQPTY